MGAGTLPLRPPHHRLHRRGIPLNGFSGVEPDAESLTHLAALACTSAFALDKRIYLDHPEPRAVIISAQRWDFSVKCRRHRVLADRPGRQEAAEPNRLEARQQPFASPASTSIAGRKAALQGACGRLRRHGLKDGRLVRLPVSSPLYDASPAASRDRRPVKPCSRRARPRQLVSPAAKPADRSPHEVYEQALVPRATNPARICLANEERFDAKIAKSAKTRKYKIVLFTSLR